ncbi:MAG: TIGR03960 family B12-binding radical SAM protein [Candidatus Omnitrophota bacterium]
MDDKLKDILSRVRKPGRYIGCETNSVVKEHNPNRTSIVLAYPDTYEIGMSYLGLKILYHLINEREDALCERVFAPWIDMEKELLDNDMKLFSLETKRPMNKFDVVGFSLCYELTYTNVLNMLHLGGVTLLSKERKEEEPIVIAGGACCYNPEPMSPFFDAVVIGDGEEVIQTFIDVYRISKKEGKDRRSILKQLSKIEGVYVPSLYEAEYENEKFMGLKSKEKDVLVEIKGAFVKDLENAYYPTKQLVPLVNIVQDRIAVEIMRGCPNKCRFCQASAINRPVRLRSPEKVRQILKEAYERTGYEKVSLLSLSSVNYPYLADLVRTLTGYFKDKGVGISIPSLRIDKAFYELPEMIAAIKKAGLTFAVESTDEKLRKDLAKEVDVEVLCRCAYEAFKHGWRRLKLYFIVGFSFQKENEADQIMKLARELSVLKKEVTSSPAEIKVSVNAFVPKAHTPMQWLGMKDKKDLAEIREGLFRGKTKKVTVEFSNIDQSILEGCLSRAERKVGDVIYEAWKNGAKMDGWTEFFDVKVWEDAFRNKGMNMQEYAGKLYDINDVLPWEHIRTNTKKDWLRREFEEAEFSR